MSEFDISRESGVFLTYGEQEVALVVVATWGRSVGSHIEWIEGEEREV